MAQFACRCHGIVGANSPERVPFCHRAPCNYQTRLRRVTGKPRIKLKGQK